MAIGNEKKITLNTCELTKEHNCIECSYESPLETLLLDEFENEVNALLNHRILTTRNAEIIRMRYGFGENKDHTYKEIASKFEITGNRIRQLEKNELKKLKKFIKKVDGKIFCI